MKKIISLCLILVVMTSLIHAQDCFEKVFRHFSNDFYAKGSVTTSDSALVMSCYNLYSNEYNILKVTETGQTEWQITEKDSAAIGKPVRIGSTLYFIGKTAYPRYNPYLLAMNEDGQKLWSKEFVSDSGYSCTVNDIATDGNQLFLSVTFTPGSNWNFNVPGLICLDTLGNISWVKRNTTGGNASVIQYNSARNEFVRIFSDGVYSYIDCFDADGNSIWTKSIDIMFNGSVSEIIPDSAGSHYLLLGNYHYNEPIILALDPASGNLIWSRMVYFDNLTNSKVLCAGTGGGFYLGVSSWINTMMIKFSAHGHAVSAKKYFNTSQVYDDPNAVASILPASAGRIWISGDHMASGSFHELFCVLADSNGFTGCQPDLAVSDSVWVMNLVNTSLQSQPVQMTERNVFETFSAASLTQQLLCTSTLGMAETEKTAATVFPNPASSVLNFQFGENPEIRTLRIYDSFGREIVSKEINASSLQISVEEFASGLYSYRLECKTSKTISGNFVVE